MAIVKKARAWACERGAEVIEFAIVLPLLLLVIFGMIDFGFLFQRYLILTNAAMEGARVGVLPGYDNTDAEARAKTYAEESGIPDAATTVTATAVDSTVPGVGGGTWPGVEVTVSYFHNYSYIGPVAELFGGSFSSVKLTARATMRSQIGSPAP